MKKFALFFSVLFLFLFLFNNHFNTLDAQELVLNSSVTGVCYAGQKVTRIYIPPPKEFYMKRGSKGIASVTFYYTGFPANVIPAMERAALILETILPADTKVTIQASWESISDANILGQSVITGYAPGFLIDALNPLVYYPVSLAEKIAGKSLNSDIEGDVQLAINSSINWYLGLDGRLTDSQYDLITVVLHEICHGLGFFDSMYANGTSGGYGFSSAPIIYDTFIEDITGKRLTDTLVFSNPSVALYNEYTGGQLYFNGPLVNNYMAPSKVKLYAPPKWDPGSSISHLDEQPATLPVNSLMTPFIDLGEAIHDPGKLTMSILGDLGWINTKILHQKPKDTEEHITEVQLSVTINSDTTYNRNKTGLVYSYNNFDSKDTIFIISPNSDNNFTATVAIPSYETYLEYYFFTEDKFLRLYRSPSLAELNPYHVYVGTDTVKPVILHTPVEYYFQKIDNIKFSATVTDNIGIDTVYVEYRKNEDPSKYIGLKSGKVNIFSTSFSAIPESLKGGDSIQYRIFAVDKSSRNNVAVSPKSGYYSIPIEEIASTLENYSTDFSNASGDFFNKGFNIAKYSGFSSEALHSEHPYASPEDNSKSFNFTAMLRHPVIFDPSGMIISYNELVLVEPGESGSLFGSSGFYDYVILEVSKDYGNTWLNLIDGYDSRFIPSWESAYNSLIDADGNSTFVGEESMMVKHTIFPLESDSIRHGDTLLFRFRLYSDPFANGWGWVIDDLKINQLVDNVEKITTDAIKVYPNPGNGIITIQSEDLMSKNRVRFNVFNSAGICILDDYINGTPEAKIDISKLPAGFYILKLYLGDGIRTFRYSLVK